MRNIIFFILIIVGIGFVLRMNTGESPVQNKTVDSSYSQSDETFQHFDNRKPEQYYAKYPQASHHSNFPNGDVIPGEYIFGFSNRKTQESFIELATSRGFQIRDRLDFAHAVRIGFDSETALKQLLKDGPNPVSQGPNHVVRIPSSITRQPAEQTVPYSSFRGSALSWRGVEDDNTRRGEGVTVAVLDTGIIPQTFSLGQSIVYKNMLDPEDPEYNDPGVHGTAVASLVGSTSSVFPGIAPGVDILSVKVLSGDGTGDAFTVAKGIVTAVDSGADVINLSLGSEGDNHLLREAVAYAIENDVAVVASVGNNGVASVTYPAQYDEVIAVGAIDAAGSHLHFSNTGEEIDISAPGLDIFIQVGEKNVASFSGTSASAPFVSGAIAYLLSENPEYTPAEAASILVDHANDTGTPGKDMETGHGILDAGRLMERNTSGIYDVALVKPYVHEAAENAEEMTVSVIAQNRGTEVLNVVTVSIETNDTVYEKTFHDVPVNQSIHYDFSVPRSSSQYADAVSVSCKADLTGIKDTYPADNTGSWTVAIPPISTN